MGLEGRDADNGESLTTDRGAPQQPHPHRVRGAALFGQQFNALMIKNALLAWRNKGATFMQLFASFFFIFLIFAVESSIKSALSQYTEFRHVETPAKVTVPGILACDKAYNVLTPCYDFLWSGNESAIITSLVRNLTASNPGRPIDFETQVLGFQKPSDVDDWLLANPMRTAGALHFAFTPTGDLGFAVQTNSTAKIRRGIYEDPTFDHQVPLQVAAEREIARYIAQDWSLSWQPSYGEFAHPAFHTLSAMAVAGPTFLFAACMFNFVTQSGNLVVERELKLRQAMATMGLMDSVFWLTWLGWEVMVAVASCLLLNLFGMMFQFGFFLKNSFGVLFFVFFLFWLAMTGLAFLVSTFIRSSSNANTTGFFIFIVGFVLQLVVLFGFPYEPEFAPLFRILFNLFPPNLLTLALKQLGEATKLPESPGVQWGSVGRCAPGNPKCTMTVAGIFVWMLVDFFVFFLLAIYFDNVLPDVNGVRKPCLYFLKPSYWTGRAALASDAAGCCSSALGGRGGAQEPIPREGEEDEDVREEEVRVRAAAACGEVDPNVAVSVRGLVKTFPSRRAMKGWRCKASPPFHAVKGTWVDVEKDKLFCLLGPNGAGKSTTIHCLTGIIPSTAGDGLVHGHSICDPSSLSPIRSLMGVCPQFDILWSCLSGREHLFLFARIKGLPPAMIAKESAMLLEEVRLTSSQHMRTSGYSGGMRRRLSVAIALIGDPKVVYLDEPTTGMDPISRRHVWDIIERAKRGRAIILTTHSMEEADILADRIAIMARGRMRCIGTSIHLKNRFGAGFVVTVGVRGAGASGQMSQSSGSLASPLSVPSAGLSPPAGLSPDASEGTEPVKTFFYQRLGVEPVDESRGYVKFLVPREREHQLTSFFHDLKAHRQSLGVVDTQLSLSTLEEVFLNIARMAELETAQAEGRFAPITLEDGRVIEVPIGAECVAIGEDGESRRSMVVDVTWHQDESGQLVITNHSRPRPAEDSLPQ